MENAKFEQSGGWIEPLKQDFLREIIKGISKNVEDIVDSPDCLDVFPQEVFDLLKKSVDELKTLLPEHKGIVAERILSELRAEFERREQAGEGFPLSEIKYFLLHAPREAERAGIEGWAPRWVATDKTVFPENFSPEKWNDVQNLSRKIVRNLDDLLEDIKNLPEGQKIIEILKSGGNVVFLATHPSRNSLALPNYFLNSVDPNLSAGKKHLLLAPGPLMFTQEKEKFVYDPLQIMNNAGLNVWITDPKKKNGEDSDLIKMADSIVGRFIKEFVELLGRMKKEGGEVFIMAPEGSQTPKNAIKKISDPVKHLLEKFSQNPKTHFAFFGIQELEEDDKAETATKSMSVKINLVDSSKFQEGLKENGENYIEIELGKLAHGSDFEEFPEIV